MFVVTNERDWTGGDRELNSKRLFLVHLKIVCMISHATCCFLRMKSVALLHPYWAIGIFSQGYSL